MTPEQLVDALVAAQAANWHVIPPAVSEVAEFVFRVALILGAVGIPVAVFYAGWLSDQRRATLDVCRTLGISPEILDRSSRLYRYRLYEDEVIKQALTTEGGEIPTNPYEGQEEHSIIFDTVIVLNYYESICTEIVMKAIREDILYETNYDIIIGVKEIILSRFEKMTGSPSYETYPYLDEIAGRWHERARRERKTITDRVPKVVG